MPRRKSGLQVQARRIPGSIWLGALGLSLVLGSVWSQSRVDRLGHELSREREVCRELEGRVEVLSQRTRRFSSLRDVAPHAERELGLGANATDRMFVIEFEKRSGSLVPDLVPEVYAAEPGNSPR